ncbi:unnamed protein product, partial [Discosporangium mesarthrocarpum]
MIDLPVAIHAAMFASFGSLAIIPSGEFAMLSAGQGAGDLSQLRSEILDQHLTLFSPYIRRLTDEVSSRGTHVSPALQPEVAPWLLQ